MMNYLYNAYKFNEISLILDHFWISFKISVEHLQQHKLGWTPVQKKLVLVLWKPLFDKRFSFSQPSNQDQT